MGISIFNKCLGHSDPQRNLGCIDLRDNEILVQLLSFVCPLTWGSQSQLSTPDLIASQNENNVSRKEQKIA